MDLNSLTLRRLARQLNQVKRSRREMAHLGDGLKQPDALDLWNLTFSGACIVRLYPFVMRVCNAERCGLLADGQACTHLTTRGSAAITPSLVEGGSLVVLTEGGDLCPIRGQGELSRNL